MWALLGGFFVGRGFRNAALPDSVKQQRYDARLARKEARRPKPRAPGTPLFSLGSRIFIGVAVLAIFVIAVVGSATN